MTRIRKVVRVRARTFSYDAVARLTKVDEPQASPNPPLTRESYKLDAEGNRIASQLSSFYVTTQANRLIEDANATYEYDVDGNQVKKTVKATGEVWQYAYDAFDRMISANRAASAGAQPKDQITYTYDALDRRTSRQAYLNTFSAVNFSAYFHDGWDIDSIDDSTSFFGAISRRSWFTRKGLDDIVAVTLWDGVAGPSTASAYYANDYLGSVRALHDDTGTIVADLDYDSFGNPGAAVQTVDQPFRYTGQLLDPTTGLYHYRTRDYDPHIGRFMQEDSIWFNSSDMNVYRYVGSNPIINRDPYGRAAAAEYAVVGGVLVTGGIVNYGLINSGQKAKLVHVNSANGLQASGGGLACIFFVLSDALYIAMPGTTVLGIDAQQCGVNIALSQAKPKDVPPNTKPIDKCKNELDLSKEDVHSIKEGCGAGPKDWTGITKETGHVWTDDGRGKGRDHGPYTDYLP